MNTRKPVIQANQSTSEPVKPVIPVSKETSKLVNEDTSKPVLQLTSKSMLASNTSQQVKLVSKIIEGKKTTGEINRSVLEQAKMLLIQKGFTIDKILDDYIHVLAQKEQMKFKGSDYLTVLERLSEIHGLKTKNEEKTEDSFVKSIQNAPINDIKVMFVQITTSAKQYMEELEKIEDAEIIG